MMMDLGNLYTASLPAWIAAGFLDAAEQDHDLTGARLLTVGYGSGDAAEAAIITVQPGWKEAAMAINIREALDDKVVLTQAQYEALHDVGEVSLDGRSAERFRIDHIGQTHEPTFQDVGVEYYRYAAG